MIYSLCINVNMVALWIFPVVFIYIALYYVKEGIKDGMLERKLNMQELNSLFNRFSTVIMAMIFSNVIIWLPVLL